MQVQVSEQAEPVSLALHLEQERASWPAALLAPEAFPSREREREREWSQEA